MPQAFPCNPKNEMRRCALSRCVEARKMPSPARGCVIAASLLLVVVLPQDTIVLPDQVVSAHIRSMAMLARAWLLAHAETQYRSSGAALLCIYKLLEMMI
jgi:hypothetical protein